MDLTISDDTNDDVSSTEEVNSDISDTSPDTETIANPRNIVNSKKLSHGPSDIRAFGVIVDRIEVYNSVEVKAPGIESRPQDLVKQYRRSDGGGEKRSSSKADLLGYG